MKAEKESFIEAYNEHADALFRYAISHVSDREVSKDLVQESFFKTWNYISKGGVVDNLKAFLFRTLKNLVIDYYRLKRHQSLDILLEDGFEPEEDVSFSIEDYADSHIAMDALDNLPVEYKDVIIMRYVQGFSFGEIASVTGEEANAVTVRHHRAIKKLKSILDK